jgi:2-(1,2-epoxy-1,2-dihydrophenyl)acetyl-CoA isomerase
VSHFEYLKVEHDGDVLEITFNRPRTLNALSVKVADELCAALAIAEGDEFGAVLLTGEGRAFCSGADLKNLDGPKKRNGTNDFERALRQHYNHPVMAIRNLPKPVVAAVNGPAAGIAVAYALACDLVVAARSSYFLLSFLNIGLTPDGGASVLVPARAGTGRFARMALLCERLSAEEALGCGLVDQIEDDDAMLASARALAHRLAGGAQGAQALVKRMINEGPLAGLEAALALEAEIQGTRGDSPEFEEGVAAFLEKRPPRFERV